MNSKARKLTTPHNHHTAGAGDRLASRIQRLVAAEREEMKKLPNYKRDRKREVAFAGKYRARIESYLKHGGSPYDSLIQLLKLLLEECKACSGNDTDGAVRALGNILEIIKNYLRRLAPENVNIGRLTAKHAYELCWTTQHRVPREVVADIARLKLVFPVLHYSSVQLRMASKKYLEEIQLGERVPWTLDGLTRRLRRDTEADVDDIYNIFDAAGISVSKIHKGNRSSYWEIAKRTIIPIYFKSDLADCFDKYQLYLKSLKKTIAPEPKYKSQKENAYLFQIEREFKSMAKPVEKFSNQGDLTKDEKTEALSKILNFLRSKWVKYPGGSEKVLTAIERPARRKSSAVPRKKSRRRLSQRRANK